MSEEIINKPVFTPKQTQSTLNASLSKSRSKKQKQLMKTRFILQTPVPQSNFQTSIEDSAKIINALKLFPRLVLPKMQVPWSAIKCIPKEARKAFRSEFHGVDPLPFNEDIRTSIILGVNNVTKCLEELSAEIVLISDDVNPMHMVTHIINMCKTQQLPILLITDLRKTLLDVFGVGSICLAVHKNDCGNQLLNKLVVVVNEVWPTYETNADNIPDETRAEQELDLNIARPKKIKVVDDKNVQTDVGFELLIRKDARYRVFTPPTIQKQVVHNTEEFIALQPSAASSAGYIGAQVAKVSSNKERKKKSRKKMKSKGEVGMSNE